MLLVNSLEKTDWQYKYMLSHFVESDHKVEDSGFIFFKHVKIWREGFPFLFCPIYPDNPK